MIYFIILTIVQAYNPLHLQAEQPTLRNGMILYLHNQTLIEFNPINGGNNIVSNGVLQFVVNQEYILVWNGTHSLVINDHNTLIELPDVHFENCQIYGNKIVAISDLQSLVSYDIGTQLTTILNKQQQCNDNTTLNSYQDDTNTYSILPADHHIHKIPNNINYTCANDAIWLTTQHPEFNATAYSNGGIYFLNNSVEFKLIFPSNILFWAHEDTFIKMEYLFSVQDAYIFAIYSNKAVCYQYYRTKQEYLQYENILCMKVPTTGHELVQVGYHNQIQLLISDQDQYIFLDHYNQCMLFQTLEEPCNICEYTTEECPMDCHLLRQNRCNADFQHRRIGGGFVLFSLLFILLFATLFVQCIASLGEIWKLFIIFISMVCQVIFCIFPKACHNLYIFLSSKFRTRRILRLPVSNSEICPICLGDVISPKFFSCKRHAACEECYIQYQKSQPEGIVCPFRD